MAFDPRSQLIPSVKYVIPVASGKGGVGKSTVSVNLALALAKLGARVGLMDADVYGPSIPTLMGADAQPEQKDNKITPPVSHGIKLISMGFFTPKGDAVIWRGPMLSKMVDQFLGSVDWGELDYLIVDLPPGTGDIQLSLCQRIPLTGAVIVSTPQDLAFEVAEKAIVMFKKLRTPILGLVENMSGFICSQCNHEEDIFGKGGAQSNSKKHNIPFLGDIPLATKIRETSDSGRPIVIADPESLSAKAFLEIAKKLKSQVEKTELSEATEKPEPKEITMPSKTDVRILWKDGHESEYKNLELRANCPCAQCLDEMTGQRKITAGSIRLDIHPMSTKSVGNYAVQFVWSEGHSTGIYTYEYLRHLCPCSQCKAKAARSKMEGVTRS